MARILVTRAAHQASALAGALREAGLEPILVPTIEIAPPASYGPLDSVLGRLEQFHWIVFTSANAVEVFGRRLHEANGSGQAPLKASEGGVKIAAIGPATARALAGLGLQPSLVPSVAVAEELAAALVPLALQPGGARTRFLLVCAEAARPTLPDALRAAGGEVSVVSAYRTVLPAESLPRMQALFGSPEQYPQAVMFTSSSTVHHLLALLEAANLSLPAQVLRVSIGPITSQTLRNAQLPPHAEASTPTAQAMVESVLIALRAAANG
jgi:uroporphyrinogen-III synthase